MCSCAWNCRVLTLVHIRLHLVASAAHTTQTLERCQPAVRLVRAHGVGLLHSMRTALETKRGALSLTFAALTLCARHCVVFPFHPLMPPTSTGSRCCGTESSSGSAAHRAPRTTTHRTRFSTIAFSVRSPDLPASPTRFRDSSTRTCVGGSARQRLECRFAPDERGEWRGPCRFVPGRGVAVSLGRENAGERSTSMASAARSRSATATGGPRTFARASVKARGPRTPTTCGRRKP
jgi:hypothetical protein